MSGGKGSNYRNDVLTWGLTTATSPSRPTSWTVHLYTDTIAKDGSNNPIYVEPSSEATTTNCPGYSAQNVTFSTPSNGSTSNNIDVAFTATGAWTQVTYYKVIDNNGSVKYWSPLSTARTLQVSGDKLDFAVGAISVSEA